MVSGRPINNEAPLVQQIAASATAILLAKVTNSAAKCILLKVFEWVPLGARSSYLPIMNIPAARIFIDFLVGTQGELIRISRMLHFLCTHELASAIPYRCFRSFNLTETILCAMVDRKEYVIGVRYVGAQSLNVMGGCVICKCRNRRFSVANRYM